MVDVGQAKREALGQFVPPAASECGSLGICHLKRWWSIASEKFHGRLSAEAYSEEWAQDTALFDVLGVGIEQIFKPDRLSGDFSSFVRWLDEVNPYRSPEKIAQFNALIRGESATFESTPLDVLSTEQLQFWQLHGYVVVPEAIPRAQALATQALIWEALAKDPSDPASWYETHPLQQGIMVQLFQHPQLDANRHAPRVRGAFAQIWQRNDLWVNTDRVGFNPPLKPGQSFQGTPIHWDVSLKLPIPFGVQGLIYLGDTRAEQGALTLIPGMHRQLERWLASLPEGAKPREQDLRALDPVPIAAQAGDLVIWHQALAHGASPNRANYPRFVQYLSWQPIDRVIQLEWV